MSATGRSDVRHADDFYSTPVWCTQLIWEKLFPDIRATAFILDPCCGDGAIMRCVGLNARGFEHNHERVLAARKQDELVEERDALSEASWIVDSDGSLPEAIITNPPYRLAEEFVRRALSEVASPGGIVAMLLRLNWLASKRRAAFHRDNPSDVYVLSRRPSFTGGGTDATEYAWFVWGPNRGNRWFILDEKGKST